MSTIAAVFVPNPKPEATPAPLALAGDADAPRFLALSQTIGAIALGGAVATNDGQLHWFGLQLLAVAIVALAGGAILCRGSLAGRVSERLVFASLLIAVFGQIVHLIIGGLSASADRSVPSAAVTACMVLLGSGVCTSIFTPRRGLGVAVMLGAFALAAWGCIWAAPTMTIDVLMFQRESADALLAGTNPYTVRYRDIYVPGSGFYGAGVSVDGYLTYSFPYPPLSLLLVLPGHVLGDVRYAHAAAMIGAAGFLIAAGRNKIAILSAALLLTSPRTLFVLQRGWTEPLLILCAAAVVYQAERRRSVWLSVGLLLAVKQYMILIAPLLLLPPWRARRRLALLVLLVCAGTMAPFFVANPAAFTGGVIQWQWVQPFRYDALSFAALRGHLAGAESGGAAGFFAASAALLLAAWKAPRTAGGLMASAALVFVSFFALNKQAFCNYYWFVIGLCSCAIVGLCAQMQWVARPTDKRVYFCATGGCRRE